jgi:hypothetical protein
MTERGERGASSLVRRVATGPRTPAGKMRSRRNARRHGLAVPLHLDSEYSAQIESVSRQIAGQSASEAVIRLTRSAAEAQLDVISCRQARCRVIEAATGDRQYVLNRKRSLVKELIAIDRYERRALLRRNRALQNIDCQRLLEAISSETA